MIFLIRYIEEETYYSVLHQLHKSNNYKYNFQSSFSFDPTVIFFMWHKKENKLSSSYVTQTSGEFCLNLSQKDMCFVIWLFPFMSVAKWWTN